jgi:putative SOS response-associated peptidase YedK
MCGRVRLSSDYSEIKIKLKFDLGAPGAQLYWNLPPTRPMLVAIRSQDAKWLPKMMRRGLLPHWAKDEKISYSTFNARSEEFTTKAAFRDAWKRGQRCLVVNRRPWMPIHSMTNLERCGAVGEPFQCTK